MPEHPEHAADSSFPKSNRLLRTAEYTAVFDKHLRRYDKYFRLLIRKRRDGKPARLGIVVSKRSVRRSTDRTHIKRQIREVFRTKPDMPKNCDLVVIANKECLHASNAELRESLNNLFSQVRVVCRWR